MTISLFCAFRIETKYNKEKHNSVNHYISLKKYSHIKLIPSTLLPPISAPEKTWTYKCTEGKCVRHHYLGEQFEKRIPFLTCSMTCGPSIVWPQPTIKSTIGTDALSFMSDGITLKLKTIFKKVDELFRQSFEIFRDEIKLIENANEESLKVDKEKEQKENNINVLVNNDNEIINGRNKRHADGLNFEVEVIIRKYHDIYLTLDSDESYNLTVSRK